MSTSYHINIRSLVLKALVSPAESLSLLVLLARADINESTQWLSVKKRIRGVFILF